MKKVKIKSLSLVKKTIASLDPKVRQKIVGGEDSFLNVCDPSWGITSCRLR